MKKKKSLNIWYISWIQTRTEGEDNRSTIKWFRCAFFLWGSYWTCITPSSKVWICSNFLCSIPCSPFGGNKCVPLRPHIWEKPLSFGTCSFYPADILHIQYTPCSLSLFLILFGENMTHCGIEIVYILRVLSSLISGAWTLSLLWLSHIHNYFCEEIPEP